MKNSAARFIMPWWAWFIVVMVCTVVGAVTHPLVGLCLVPIAAVRISGASRKRATPVA